MQGECTAAEAGLGVRSVWQGPGTSVVSLPLTPLPAERSVPLLSHRSLLDAGRWGSARGFSVAARGASATHCLCVVSQGRAGLQQPGRR